MAEIKCAETDMWFVQQQLQWLSDPWFCLSGQRCYETALQPVMLVSHHKMRLRPPRRVFTWPLSVYLSAFFCRLIQSRGCALEHETYIRINFHLQSSNFKRPLHRCAWHASLTRLISKALPPPEYLMLADLMYFHSSKY